MKKWFCIFLLIIMSALAGCVNTSAPVSEIPCLVTEEALELANTMPQATYDNCQ